MNKIIIIVFSTLLITGCFQTISSRVDIAKRAKVELVGMSKSDILNCAGIPLRTHKYDDEELLTYSNLGDSDSDFDAPGSRLLQWASALDECEVTLTLKNNAVDSVEYKTNFTGLMASEDQCAYVFEDCLTAIKNGK